jgi:DUF1365 family protein
VVTRIKDVADASSTIAAQRVSLPPLPALVRGKVHHVRYQPLRHAFTHAHHQWLVDLDVGTAHHRALRRLVDVRPEDHLAGPRTFAALKGQVLATLAAAGVDTDPVTQVVLLAHARVLGHVFDPLSTYWCLDAEGTVVAAVLEVRNTYAGRRCYVVRPDATGRAEATKDFVVSPFNERTGRYAVRLHLSPQRVATSIALSADGIPVLSAATWGSPHPATTAAVLRTAVTEPFMPHRVSFLIRWHGIALWARRLPIRTPKEMRR